LKLQKSKISENSDQNVLLLDNQLEEVTKNRDGLRDELRKTKEELAKEREELEVAQKKLISKLDRITKSKQELEAIKEDMDKAHAKSLPNLSYSILQHTSDMNPWVNILEEEREYKYKHIKIPGDEINDLEFMPQMQNLRNLVVRQNINFEKVLIDRSKEKQEVISVAMGKLKKREKTKQEKEAEIESGQVLEDSDEEPIIKKSTAKTPSSEGVEIPKVNITKIDTTKQEKKGFVKATSPRARQDGEKK